MSDMNVVIVDYKKCIGCENCYIICPMDVFKWDLERDMPLVAHDDECWFCGSCWQECPKRAIDIKYPACFW
jgi:NAD-dependent dihydropyrimidine dehydrogenase PreA subunit